MYYPDSSGCVYVRGLGELAEGYIQSADLTTCRKDYALVSDFYPLSIIVYSSTDQKSIFTCSFAMCRDLTTMDTEAAMFFTRFREKRVRAEQYNCLYWYDRSTYSVVAAVAYVVAGAMCYTRLAMLTADADTLCPMLCFTAAGVLAELNKEKSLTVSMDDVAYIDVYLVKTADSGVADRVRFNIDSRHYAQLFFAEYYNLFGKPESMFLTGKDTSKVELDGEFAQADKVYRKIFERPIESHESSVGFAASEERGAVLDLIRSRRVFIWSDSYTRREVTITDATMERSLPRSTPDSYKISWRPVAERSDTYTRPALPTSGVFDTSFDETFE
jgi:hypothetical protein